MSTAASSVALVSVEPPMLLVCLERGLATSKAIDRLGSFIVSTLSENQMHLVELYLGKDVRQPNDLDDPQILVEDSLVHLECALTERATSASHILFVGLVEAGSATSSRNPLVYYRGRYGRFVEGTPSPPDSSSGSQEAGGAGHGDTPGSS